MSEATNTELVERLVEKSWNNVDLSVVDECVHPDAVDDITFVPTVDEDADMVETYKQQLRQIHDAFDDVTVELTHVVADESTVAYRWIGEATHTGAFLGIPPTDETVQITAQNLLEIEDGMITAAWGQYDTMGLMQQLGVAPSMDAPSHSG